MRLFSYRKGLKPIKKIIQLDDMDSELRNSLWNALDAIYWSKIDENKILKVQPEYYTIVKRLWADYFILPVDTIKKFSAVEEIKDYFFKCKWFEVYDFLEFIVNNNPDNEAGIYRRDFKFKKLCNQYLERELSGYRFVGNKITEITSDTEINEIEEALDSQLKSVQNHLERALILFSDRKTPDYRNSIKEAISAVEAISKVIVKDDKTTLGRALTYIEKKTGVELHSSLKDAFKSLYGYTSDAEGIRHALMDELNLSAEDAKFMLIACSAFINYLTEKASKAGIKLI